MHAHTHLAFMCNMFFESELLEKYQNAIIQRSVKAKIFNFENQIKE